HLVSDGGGLPLAAEVTAGQRHESTRAESVLDRVRIPQRHESTRAESVLDRVRIPQRRGRPRCRPVKLAGDKGYSYPRIRRWLRRHGVRAVIPRRKDQRPDDGRVKFDQDTYKRRAVV